MLIHGSLSPGPLVQPSTIRETPLSLVRDTVSDRALLLRFDLGTRGLNSEGLSRPISMAQQTRAQNDRRMFCHHRERLLQPPLFSEFRLSLSPHYHGPVLAGLTCVPTYHGTPSDLALSFTSPVARACPARVPEHSKHPDFLCQPQWAW
jgi:hypothetical protein